MASAGDELHTLLRKFNIPQSSLEKPCDDDFFLTLSPEILSFVEVAPYFGFRQPEIVEISQDNPTERTRKLSTLCKWKRQKGSDATYLSLVKIFLRMKDKQLAEFVLENLPLVGCRSYTRTEASIYTSQLHSRTSTTAALECDFPEFSFHPRHPNGVRVAEAIDRIDDAFVKEAGNIAAIWFHNAECSVAYCTTKDEEITLLMLSSQEGQVHVPTIILVNEKGEPIKFGAGALRQYQRLDPSQQLKYHLFERIKLAHGPHESIYRDTKIHDLNGKMFFLRDVIALFIKYLKDELEKMLSVPKLTATDFHWVITVPASWTPSGKQMMREAAYQAGLCGTHTFEKIAVATGSSRLYPLEVECPERLSIALEPEAASFYCLSIIKRYIAKYSSRLAVIERGTYKHIIVDIRETTADFSIYGQISEENIEVLPSHELGGNAVNQEFEYFLTQLVGDPGFSTYLSTNDNTVNAENKVDVRSIVYDEFEDEKKEFGQTYISRYVDRNPEELDDSETIYKVKLSENFYDFYKQRLKDGVSRLNLQKHDRRVTLGRSKMLCIHYSKMEEFFDGPVSKILRILKNILDELNNDVHTIYLVGGFGGCQYMYYRIQEALIPLYGENRFTLTVPNSPHLAVVQGAIQYRKNPQITRSRVAEATYGTEIMLPFNDKIHDFQYRYTTENGKVWCKYLFSPLIVKGECIQYNHVKRIKTNPVEPSQTSVVFFIFVTNKNELHYTRRPNGDLEDGVKVLGTITLPFDRQGEHRDIYLTFDFSNTEIQVHVYDAISNTERRAVMIG